MKYKTLLFDADGTLLDFSRSEAEALTETLALNGIDANDATVALYSKINDGLWKMLERGEIKKDVLKYRRFELFLEELGVECDAKKMAQDYMKALSTKGYLLDGAEQMCKVLYGKAKLYIVTNGIEFIQRGRYARCGIDKYFEQIFISDGIGCEKPSREYFEYVARHIDDFDASSAIIIGDSLSSDMRGGLNYGIDTCWYNPNGKACPEDMKLTYIASSFDEVIGFILSEDIS